MHHGRAWVVAVHAIDIVKRIRGRECVARRSRLLERSPLCETCLSKGIVTPATIADHRVALVRGGEDEEHNLSALCHQCHEEKTRVDIGARERPTIGADGWPQAATRGAK